MNRTQILHSLIDSTEFPFWVPLITHYSSGGELDSGRMLRHAEQILPYTRLWMLAGTTGDGWDLTSDQYDQVTAYALGLDFPADRRPLILLGALRPTTAEVVERVQRLQTRLGLGADLAENLPVLREAGLVGVTVCPPVGAGLSQEQIYAHLSALCEAAHLPVVLYQLPQVTGNLIAPETLRRLLDRYAHIIMVKDSGGGDEIAQAGPYDPGLLLVRGAEGGYVEALKPAGGRYDGWLLSTGNAFAPQLAEIVTHVKRGDLPAAAGVSRRLSGLVERVFALARQAQRGNPFSSANRAADHLLAYGQAWRGGGAARLQDGSTLPADLIAKVAAEFEEEGLLPEVGYLSAG